jgi:peptidoglycan/xylan/chitin deacetylase (PgdA/CDA1 family)
MDFDDFALAGLAPDAVPIPPVQRPRPPPPPKPEEIPPRKVPPVINLKFDDVKQFKGMVFPCWTKLAEYLQSRQIKGSFGVICQSLEEATPEYVEWIKRWRDSGLVEFWFHGWDHATHEVDGVRYNEFNKRPYAEQKERFDKAQRLAQEKLGFAFETFGPTGGVGNGLFDENTVKVMADDPHLKAWLYPQPLDKAGQELEAAGKVTILDRVWAVNLEAGVGAPDFNRFLAGYAQNLTRDYFVLQGHPAAWDDNRFAEFARILDFLVAQKAVFMTPMEFVNSRKGGAGK